MMGADSKPAIPPVFGLWYNLFKINKIQENMHQKQKGVAPIIIIGIVILVLAIAGGGGYYLMNKNKQKENIQDQLQKQETFQEKNQQTQLFKDFIGSKFGNMTLVSDNNSICRFSGEVAVSGIYFRDKIFKMGEVICMEIDKKSYLKMPILDVPNVDIKLGYSNTELLYNPSHLLCFNESENSKKLVALKGSGEATILIDNYQINYSIVAQEISKADLIKVVEIKSKHVFSDNSTWEKYNNEKYGYSFKIIPSYAIYNYHMNPVNDLIDTIAIMDRSGAWTSAICECGEGGAMIEVNVWGNYDKLKLEDWMAKHLEGEPLTEGREIENIEVDGIKGLKAEIIEMGGGPDVVVEKDGLIFEIRGRFIDYSSEEFNNFIANFRFDGDYWFSPDGEKRASLVWWEFDGQTRADMMIENLKTGEKKQWYVGIGNISGVDWSLDSKKVAISAYQGHLFSGWFQILSTEKEIKDIPLSMGSENSYSYYSPQFSPNGEKVLFSGQGELIEKGGIIYVINSDGTNLKNLTNPNNLEWSPIWSKSGNKIIYVTNFSYRIEIIGDGSNSTIDRGQDEVWIMNSDGTEKKFIAKGNNPIIYYSAY